MLLSLECIFEILLSTTSKAPSFFMLRSRTFLQLLHSPPFLSFLFFISVTKDIIPVNNKKNTDGASQPGKVVIETHSITETYFAVEPLPLVHLLRA